MLSMGLRPVKRDVKSITIYRTTKTDSGYIGTVEEETLIGTVDAIVSPVTDELAVRIYGDRIEKMLQFTLMTPVNVRYGDKIVLGGQKYRVIGKPEYSDHINVRGELE